MFDRLSVIRQLPGARIAIVTLGTMIGLSAGPTAAAALPSGCSQSGAVVTCTYTSGVHRFVVPPDVSLVHVEAVGGMGASAKSGGHGGHGALVRGNIHVTPGETLDANVGVNGGGDGGSGGGPFSSEAGHGGGASDVRKEETALSSRLLVAGGGGGGGNSAPTQFGPSLSIGGAGGNAGSDGSGAGGNSGSGGYAGGATGSGIGGSAGTACVSFCIAAQSGARGGFAATVASGGGGGMPALELTVTGFPPCEPPSFQVMQACFDVINAGGAGGGGGGGSFGGGGGGGGGILYGGGGGGGGSSMVPPGGSVSVSASSVPQIKISYQT